MVLPLRIIQGFRGLREKGITYSRQRLLELIRAGRFPAPDGRTTDHPNSPPWWFETTVDRHLRKRAAKYAAFKKTSTSQSAEPSSPPVGGAGVE
jgi:hypothetical protein